MTGSGSPSCRAAGRFWRRGARFVSVPGFVSFIGFDECGVMRGAFDPGHGIAEPLRRPPEVNVPPAEVAAHVVPGLEVCDQQERASTVEGDRGHVTVVEPM